jgi:hypothetical protein
MTQTEFSSFMTPFSHDHMYMSNVSIWAIVVGRHQFNTCFAMQSNDSVSSSVGVSSFPLASHHRILPDADVLRRDLQSSSQIVGTLNITAGFAEHAWDVQYMPDIQLSCAPTHALTSTSSSSAMYSRQSSRDIWMGGLSTTVASFVALQWQQRLLSMKCLLVGQHVASTTQVSTKYVRAQAVIVRTAGAPADVGGCLALAGIDRKVARTLVDANDLALVDVLPRLDEQSAARLDTVRQ